MTMIIMCLTTPFRTNPTIINLFICILPTCSQSLLGTKRPPKGVKEIDTIKRERDDGGPPPSKGIFPSTTCSRRGAGEGGVSRPHQYCCCYYRAGGRRRWRGKETNKQKQDSFYGVRSAIPSSSLSSSFKIMAFIMQPCFVLYPCH